MGVAEGEIALRPTGQDATAAALVRVAEALDRIEESSRRAAGAAEESSSALGRIDFMAQAAGALRLAESLGRIAAEGDRSSDILSSVTADMAGLQRATAGTVSQLQLAEAAARAQNGTLRLTQRELEAVIAHSTNLARKTGQDVVPTTQALTRALERGSSEGLRRFGIEANSTSGALAQLTGRLGENQRELGETAGAFDRASTQVDNAKDAFKRLVSEGVNAFLTAVSLIGDRSESNLDRAAAAARAALPAFADLVNAIATIAGFDPGAVAARARRMQDPSFASGSLDFRREAGARGLSVAQGEQLARQAVRMGRDPLEFIRSAPISDTARARMALQDTESARSAIDAEARRIRQQERDRRTEERIDEAFRRGEARLRRRGRGGGGGRERGEGTLPTSPEDARALAQTLEDLEDEELEQLRRTPSNDGPRDANLRPGQRNARDERDAVTGRGVRGAQQAERQRALEGTERTVRAITAEARALEHLRDVGSQALDTLSGAVEKHVSAWVNGQQSIGAALKGILADSLAKLAAESAVKAVFFTAEGFGHLASLNFVGAGQAFTAAAIYGTVAAGAALGSRAFASSGSRGRSEAGSAGAEFGRSRGDFAAANDGTRGPTINNYTITFGGVLFGTPEQLGEHFARGLNALHAATNSGVVNPGVIRGSRAA